MLRRVAGRGWLSVMTACRDSVSRGQYVTLRSERCAIVSSFFFFWADHRSSRVVCLLFCERRARVLFSAVVAYTEPTRSFLLMQPPPPPVLPRAFLAVVLTPFALFPSLVKLSAVLQHQCPWCAEAVELQYRNPVRSHRSFLLLPSSPSSPIQSRTHDRKLTPMLHLSRRCYGGHGDFLPTTKAAAHIAPEWIMGRQRPPPPGKDHCYVEVRHRASHSKFQSVVPESHEVLKANMRGHLPDHHGVDITTHRFSDSAVQRTLTGLSTALNTHVKKVNNNPVANANIAGKAMSEDRTKQIPEPRHHPLMYAPGYEPLQKVSELQAMQDGLELRTTNLMGKLQDGNPKGFVQERFKWQESIPPPPQPRSTAAQK